MKQSKLKIAIVAINFCELTGVEMYIYELSRVLIQRGHDVLIAAPRIGGEVNGRALENGVRVHDFDHLPIGWVPDVLHLNEFLPSAFALSRWPNVPAVATIHSQYSVEEPFLSERINKYICIRKEVQANAVKQYSIPHTKTEIIHNGVDFTRFKTKHPNFPDHKTILFVGTIDLLRRKTIEHLIERSKTEKFKLIIVGKKHAPYLDSLEDEITVLPPTWNVSKYIENATETAGILLGRTTIEGWVAGRAGWIYDVDLDGNIKSFKLFKPPNDLQKFNAITVAEKIEDEYLGAIANKNILVNNLTFNQDVATIAAAFAARSIYQGMTIYDIINRLGEIDELKSNYKKLFNAVQEIQDNQANIRDTKLMRLISKFGRR